MGRKKKQEVYIRKSFETRIPGVPAETHEKYVGMCLTQLMSDAWHNLSGCAQNLYLFMRLQYNGSNDLEFNFNQSLYNKKYKLYTSGSQFKKHYTELIENGFIKLIENGKTTRTNNIFAFSDDWQNVKRKKRDMSRQNAARKRKD